MAKSFGNGDESIGHYAENLFRPEADALWETIRNGARAREIPAIHVGAMDGLHLEVLAAAFGAKKTVEIGTLAGLSGIRLLRGMGPTGRLYTFEYAPSHAKFARENFDRAGVGTQVEIFEGPATANFTAHNRRRPV